MHFTVEWAQYNDQLNQKKYEIAHEILILRRGLELCLKNTIACNDRLTDLSQRVQNIENLHATASNTRYQSRKEKLLTPEVSENEEDGEPLSSGYSGDENER